MRSTDYIYYFAILYMKMLISHVMHMIRGLACFACRSPDKYTHYAMISLFIYSLRTFWVGELLLESETYEKS